MQVKTQNDPVRVQNGSNAIILLEAGLLPTAEAFCINSVDDASFLGWRAGLRPLIGGQSVAGLGVSAKLKQ